MADHRGGRASQALTALVIATYGPICHLRLPGCTRVATTKDHLIPYSHGGTLDLSNLRPACKPCNSKRGNRVLNGYGARVVVVIGPPASGKTTYVRDNAAPGDVVIDLDVIARALMPNPPDQTHTYPEYVRSIAIGARQAAIDRATHQALGCTLYIIHALPHPNLIAEYRALRYSIVTIDPGRETVERRARAERPSFMLPQIARWYASDYSAPEPAAITPSPALASSSSSTSASANPEAEW